MHQENLSAQNESNVANECFRALSLSDCYMKTIAASHFL